MHRWDLAAYGGKGWSPRNATMQEEIGRLWRPCGIENEYAALKAILLHRPGKELAITCDPNDLQMLEAPDLTKTQKHHDDLAEAYRANAVEVFYVDPPVTPPPNMIFLADLFFMTPEGAILARPASTVRAGEERHVAGKLAALGIPILTSIHGKGTFEGADAMWVDRKTVIIARGIRTNHEGGKQIESTLKDLGVNVVYADLPYGTMHLMGVLRIVDRNLAVGWPSRLSYPAVCTLREHGYEMLFLPDESEAINGMALNFVTLGPRKILLPQGNPITRKFYEEAGIVCQTVEIDELMKAAGGIGCLTGIVHRDDTEMSRRNTTETSRRNTGRAWEINND